MPSPSLESALVRILRAEGELRRPVGAGFLVSPQHIITCAHVVNCAFGLPKNAADQSEDELFLDFPLLTDRPLLRAKILRWFPVQDDSSVGEIQDIAVLELLPEIPLPDEARPAPIVAHKNYGSSLEVKMCGFPFGASHGTYAKGRPQGLNEKGWIEIHHQGNELVEAGFSGTAAWATEENAVCGMIVGILKRTHSVVAYMIPAAVLFKAFPDMPLPVNPYRGLEVFREQDAHFYFGRDEAVARLRKIAEKQHFTAVIGASGSGKSSLVFAGLMPALRQTDGWLIADCRPKKDPFLELAASLFPFLYDAEPDELERIKKTKQCAAALLSGELNLSDLVRRITEKNDRHRFLLIVDQFEELYTPNADKDLARSFVNLLLEASQTDDFNAVITLRADFMSAAASCGVFAEALNSSQPLFIPAVENNDLLQMVEKPAALQHVAFEHGLADLIVSELDNEPSNLPLLEFCLTQLWKKQQCREITHAVYQDIGGVQQAVAIYADERYSLFNAEDKNRVRHIFLNLVRLGADKKHIRRTAIFEEFKPEDHGLIEELVKRRLLVTGVDTESGKSTVEIVHEALIRHWKTLLDWVEQQEDLLVWREKLEVLQNQWLESKKKKHGESALLRGLALQEALKWSESHGGYLRKDELYFIRDSEAAWIKQRKRKKIAIAAVLSITGLVAVVFFLLWKNAEQQKNVAEQKTVEANIEKDRADEQRERAEKQTLEARHNLAKAFEGKALTALKTAKQEGTWAYKQTALFTAASSGQKIDPQQPSWFPSPLAILFNAEVFHNALTEQWSSPVQQGAVRSVAFSPDGRRVASASDDKMVRIWDSTTGKEIFLLRGHTDSVWSVAFSPDGQYIASASRDKTIRIWEATSGKNLLIIQEKEKIHLPCIAFSPSGKRVAATSSGFAIRIWDVETGKELTILKGDGQATGSIAFSPDGQLLASTHNGGKIRIWNATSGQEVNSLTGHTAYEIRSVAFSPDGKTLATASWDFKFSIDNTVRLWDVNTGKELNVLKGHTNAVLSIAFSPHGKYIASASADRTIRIWDVETGTELKLLKGSDAAVSVAYNPDGSQLISAFLDNTVRVWDVNINKERKILSGHTDDIRSISFSPDSKTLASASGDKTVRIWDVVTGEEKFTLQGGHAAVRIVLFSPDGKRVASASWDHTQRVWDSKTGNVIKILKGHPSGICKIFFTADGNKLISYWSDNGHDMEGIWDITGVGLSVERSKWDRGRGINFSPDRSITASIYNVNENHSDRGVVKVMNNKTGEKINVLDGHKDTVWNISFSSDSKRIVSASEDKTVRIWNIVAGKEQVVLRGHLDSVLHAVFSPNGEMVASASRDKTVRIWDSGTGKEMNVLVHPDAVYTVAFSPNGRFLASGANDNTVRIWDVRPYTLFLHNSKPTPLYHTFIDAVKFLWQLDVEGLEIVKTKRRTPADLKKYGTLLAPPPPGQSKFDQVLEWAEKQQEK